MSRKRILQSTALHVYSTNSSKLRVIKEGDKRIKNLEKRAQIYIAPD